MEKISVGLSYTMQSLVELYTKKIKMEEKWKAAYNSLPPDLSGPMRNHRWGGRQRLPTKWNKSSLK